MRRNVSLSCTVFEKYEKQAFVVFKVYAICRQASKTTQDYAEGNAIFKAMQQ